MSVLFRREDDAGRVIEVRSAGRTRRLYVDGVFHTSWNPSRPLTGAIWDHLVLPTFLVHRDGARRALLLGVGGGAVLRMLEDLTHPERLVGVELDAELLRVARDWFGLDGAAAELVCDDAARYVRARRGVRFDLVIDDVFTEQDGDPVRPRGMDDGAWWQRLAALLAPGGVLVVNFVTRADLTSSDLCQDTSFRRLFPAAIRFSCEHYENAAVALMTSPVDPRAFRARIHAHPALRTAAARRLQRFRLHRLWPT